MNILIVAATRQEIESTLESAKAKNSVTVLISGVGMVNTTYHLTKELCNKKYDLCINAGIAGSFNKQISLGEVVCVKEDCFAELGAEDGENFLSINEMKLGIQEVEISALNIFSDAKFEKLKKVKAITVNKVHGHETSIEKIIALKNPDVESMEGAAFMFCCEKEKIKYIQLRSISNYVERRNREKWNIELAVKNLNNTLIELLEQI